MKERLTLKELIKELSTEDQDAVVAIEQNGYANTVTQLSKEGWIAGTFYMKKEPRVQKEYLCEEEVPADKKDEYIKVLVLGSLVTADEVEKN